MIPFYPFAKSGQGLGWSGHNPILMYFHLTKRKKLGEKKAKWFCLYCCLNGAAAAAKSLQLCPTLCDPIDGSLPGSSIHGIFQERVLEWVAIAFSGLNGEKL